MEDDTNKNNTNKDDTNKEDSNKNKTSKKRKKRQLSPNSQFVHNLNEYLRQKQLNNPNLSKEDLDMLAWLAYMDSP